MSLYLELIDAVEHGKKVSINLVEKTVRINGNDVNLDGELINIKDMEYLRCTDSSPWEIVEELYANYKRSVPGAKTRTNKPYFNADGAEDLTDEEMAFNMERDLAQVCLEAFVLLAGLSDWFEWEDESHWFWQSDNDKDLVILKEWI